MACWSKGPKDAPKAPAGEGEGVGSGAAERRLLAENEELKRQIAALQAPSAGSAGKRAFVTSEPEPEKKRTRVAVYGGSFNPITMGHMNTIAEFGRCPLVDEVWVVPCGTRPDKPSLKVSCFERVLMTELAVDDFFSRQFPVRVEDIEFHQEKAMGTYTLLCELRKRHPDIDFLFAIGADLVADLQSWTEDARYYTTFTGEDIPDSGKRLYAEAKFLVMEREGCPLADDLPENFVKLETASAVTSSHSSTEVRNRINFNKHDSMVKSQNRMLRRRLARGHESPSLVRTMTAEGAARMEVADAHYLMEFLVPPAVLRHILRYRLYDEAPEDEEKTTADLFKRIDVDNKGSIDKGEIQQLVASSLGAPLTEKGLADALAAMDMDGDGHVTLEEFMTWWKANDATDDTPVPRPVLASPKRKVALLGGSFNPITVGHLGTAAEIIHSGLVNEAWIVPCGSRPDKPSLKVSCRDRVTMCHLAVDSSFTPKFPVRVCDAELGLPKALSTLALLQALRKDPANDNTEFYFSIGADLVTDLRSWTAPDVEPPQLDGQKMWDDEHFLVIDRQGYEYSEMPPHAVKLTLPKSHVTGRLQPVTSSHSSSEVRRRVKAGGPLQAEGMLPQAVLNFIARNSLYLD